MKYSRRTILMAAPAIAAASSVPLFGAVTPVSASDFVKHKRWLPDCLATGIGYAFEREYHRKDGVAKVRSHPGGMGNDWTLEATFIVRGALSGNYTVRDPDGDKILEHEDIHEHPSRKMWELQPDLGDDIGQPEDVTPDGEGATIGLFMQSRRYVSVERNRSWVVYDVLTRLGWMRRVFPQPGQNLFIGLLNDTYDANGEDWLAAGRHAFNFTRTAVATHPEIGAVIAGGAKADYRIAIAIGVAATAAFGLDFIYHFNLIIQRMHEVERLLYWPQQAPRRPGDPPAPPNPAYNPNADDGPPEGAWD